jgi:hypothetical protein
VFTVPLFKGKYTSKEDLHRQLVHVLLGEFQKKGHQVYNLNGPIADGLTVIDGKIHVLEVKSKRSTKFKHHGSQLQGFKATFLVYEQRQNGDVVYTLSES